MPKSDVKPVSPYPALAATMPNIPKGSGIYLFKDAGGKVLYVGKAVNLAPPASYLRL
jgi:excinuclease UvrABC nuclease subunit